MSQIRNRIQTSAPENVIPTQFGRFPTTIRKIWGENADLDGRLVNANNRRGGQQVTQFNCPDPRTSSDIEDFLRTHIKLRAREVAIENEPENMVLEVQAVLLGFVIGQQRLPVAMVPMSMLVVKVKGAVRERLQAAAHALPWLSNRET